jgi:hypothetical protein
MTTAHRCVSSSYLGPLGSDGRGVALRKLGYKLVHVGRARCRLNLSCGGKRLV